MAKHFQKVWLTVRFILLNRTCCFFIFAFPSSWWWLLALPRKTILDMRRENRRFGWKRAAKTKSAATYTEPHLHGCSSGADYFGSSVLVVNQFYPLSFLSLFKTPSKVKPALYRQEKVSSGGFWELSQRRNFWNIEPKEDLNIAQNADIIPCMTCHCTHVREEPGNENISPIRSRLLNRLLLRYVPIC